MRLWPSWRGETTLRSSHHCNCRRLTPQIRATSLLLKPCASGEDTGWDFLALNIFRHFRCQIRANLDCTWVAGRVKMNPTRTQDAETQKRGEHLSQSLYHAFLLRVFLRAFASPRRNELCTSVTHRRATRPAEAPPPGPAWG